MMTVRTIPAAAAVVALSAVFALTHPMSAQDQPAPPDGVEVLARGPVHEAYAEPVAPRPEASPVVPKEPPTAIEELPPDQKPEGDAVDWIPGYWAWDEDRTDYIWVSGFWRAAPPGRDWVPGHWQQVERGWQWAPGFWAVEGQKEIEYTPPPPETIESGPSVPAPGDDYTYQPGTWVFMENRWVWQPGAWTEARPDWMWVPAHYVWSPAGCVFVAGYWDMPLEDRGLLFAPVAFERQLYARPNFVYTPAYVVNDDCLFGSLFVGPSRHHYFFGDYFGAPYQRRGFTPWLDFRIGRNCYDPLFSYYAYRHAREPGWERDLRGLYDGRFRGDLVAPPHTLVQQNTLIQNIHNHRVTNVTNVNSLTVLKPLHQANNRVRLQQVSHDQRVRQQQAAAQVRNVAVQRHKAEANLIAQGAPAARPGAAPQKVKVDVPRPAKAHPTDAKVRTPPPPPKPAQQHKPGPAHPSADTAPKPHTEPAAPAAPAPKPHPAPAAPATTPKAQHQPAPPPAAAPATTPKAQHQPAHPPAPAPTHHAAPQPAQPHHQPAQPSAAPHPPKAQHQPAPKPPAAKPQSPKHQPQAVAPAPHHPATAAVAKPAAPKAQARPAAPAPPPHPAPRMAASATPKPHAGGQKPKKK